MPKLTIYQVSSLGGEGKHIVGTLSYKGDESFADARMNLERMGYFDFPYDFVDDTTNMRMQSAWEKGNLLEDAGNTVTIMPRRVSPLKQSDMQQETLPKSPSRPALHSVRASYSTDTNTDSLEDSILCRRGEQEQSMQVETPPEPQGRILDPHVLLLSELMAPKLKSDLELEIHKFKEHLALCQIEDMDWCVKSSDKNGAVVVGLWCGECQTNSNASIKGAVVDKTSIKTCFANFRNGHMPTSKHVNAMAKNRGERIDSTELKRRVQASSETAKQVLGEHVAIVDEINSSQSSESSAGTAPFEILGQLDAENIELSKFKIFCNICCEHMILVPRQRNLQSNLQSHVNSKKHLDILRKRQRPPTTEAVSTGKAGRPRNDIRDNKQPRIDKFLTVSGSGAGSSSQPPISEMAQGSSFPHLDSLLCWGLWRESYKYGKYRRPVKAILNDQPKVDALWYAVAQVEREVWNISDQRTCVIKGLFRHQQCNLVSALGGGFTDLTCEKCWSILKEHDFRFRVLRELEAVEKRGTRGTGQGRRLGYLTMPEIQLQARTYRTGISRAKQVERQLKHRILMLQKRDSKLRDLCVDSANKNDILKFCNSLSLAHRRGAFGGKLAVRDLLQDIVANISRPKKGQRWRPGTKVLMQTLFQLGGRRVINCLSLNALGPSLNTLQRDRRGMIVFQAGVHAEQFKFIAQVYSTVKARLGISGPVPCYFAEDETCIKRTVRWLPRQDMLLGFCGKQGPNHECVTGLQIPVGEGEVGFKAISESFGNYKIGCQARCVMVNPLALGFPKLCLLATSTCGKFDAHWVKNQWETLDNLWTTHCFKDVGPLLGHASDGDARRRKLMIADYTSNGMTGHRQNLGWEGWVLSHSLMTVQGFTHATGLHDQDYIHNGKKLVNPLDSVTRTLQMGIEVAELGHLITISVLYDIEDHKLNAEDTKRTDRQNWASAQRLSSRKVTNTLKKCRLRQDAKVELTLGTEMYLTVCGDYIDIFLNTTLTLRERIVLCGKVSFFFRLWRLWCFHGNHSVGGNTQPISFGRNCVPIQTFLDIQMSVHFVVLLIIQFRDNFCHLPVPLQVTGSDACEQFFSKVGGMQGHERSYDMSELVDCATSLNRLAALDTLDGLVGVGKTHKKHSNIWMKLHRDPNATETVADQTDYRGIETNPEVVQALKEGLILAQNVCIELEMAPSTSCKDERWWKTPWLVEAKGVNFGGFCDLNMESLTAIDPDECLHEDENVQTNESGQNSSLHFEQTNLEDGDICDITIAEAEVQEVMTSTYNDLLYSEDRREFIDPTCTFEGKKMYKTTLISQLNDNPHLSKDRLTRVKAGLYFNNLVDKPRIREGAPTMFIQVGTDCGVYFIEDIPALPRTRMVASIAKQMKGKGRKDGPIAKKLRGEPAAVSSSSRERVKYSFWIGKVQSIQKKYGNRIGRCREPIDMLDPPSAETACKVKFNWYTPHGDSGLKYKYNLTDPQLIDLNCLISTVTLSMDSERPGIFLLDKDDHIALTEYVKNK